MDNGIDEMNTVSKILSSKNYLKCFLTLAQKNVTTKNELRYDMMVRGEAVTNFLELMEEKGYIASRLLGDIDDIHFESFIRTRGEHSYYQNPSVIILTNSGKIFVDMYYEYFAKEINSNETLQHIYTYIQEKTKAYVTAYNQILAEENSLLEREVKINIPQLGQLKYKKSTKAHKALKDHLKDLYIQKKAERENKSLKVVEEEIKSLTKLNEESQRKALTINYRGMFSHMTSQELNNYMEGISKQEEKEADKEYKKQKKAEYEDLCNMRETTHLQVLARKLRKNGFFQDKQEEDKQENNRPAIYDKLGL